jgi:phosphatidylglycerophosphatase A
VALFLLVSRLSLPVYLLLVAAIAALGVWAAAESERAFGRSDDGRIVIDEVAGQLLCLAPLVWLGGRNDPWLLVTGFVAFRCFDIWKPGPVRWAERGFSGEGRPGGGLSGGVGVMADDLLAGLLGAGAVALVGAVLGWDAVGAAG